MTMPQAARWTRESSMSKSHGILPGLQQVQRSFSSGSLEADSPSLLNSR
jgi:hypothetical protein